MQIRRLALWLAASFLFVGAHIRAQDVVQTTAQTSAKTDTQGGVQSAAQTPPVQLASVYAAVADLDSGDITFAKHADRQVPIASITKLMTAMIVLDAQQDMEEWLTVRPREQQLGKTAWTRMRNGSEARRGDLLHIALMSSENIACDVLARHFPGGLTAFVQAMNDKAASLGMSSTVFYDPAGLSPNNRSTAADLVKLVSAAYQYDQIRELSTETYKRVQFRKPGYGLDYGNTNPLVRSGRWEIGLSKTGYLSEAGRCLVMVSRIDGEDKVVVLLDSLGTRSPIGDAGRVRRWLETGDTGSIAVAAREYERQRTASYRADTVSSNVR